MRQNSIAQFVQLLKCGLCNLGVVQLGTVMEKNWALSVGQCWLQTLEFSVHIIHLLSILLGCNGLAGIQKTVVDQTGSGPPVTGTIFWLWEVLWSFFSGHPLSWLSPAVISNPLFVTSQSDGEMVHCCYVEYKWTTLQNDAFFFFSGQLRRHSLIELFHLSSLPQMPNDSGMVGAEFLGTFSRSCERIGFSDRSQLIAANLQWSPLYSPSSRLSSPLQNFLNHYCTVCSSAVPRSNVFLTFRVVSDH